MHGGTLQKIRNIEALFERAANTFLSKIKPISTERTVALAQAVHDNEFNYAIPSDYDDVIDLIPQDNRNTNDSAKRVNAAPFDLKKGFANKQLSIEGSEGTKFMRIAWKNRSPKTLNAMNSLTANGTWQAVGSTTGLKTNTIYKISGSGSCEFDLVVTGDGLKNTTMTAVDLTDEDEVADFYVWAFFGAVTNLTSVGFKFGNDLTTKYWTCVAQTSQADGTAFRIGWNLIKFSWSAATETGTVLPASIDSAQLTVNATGAINNIRFDNIQVSIGRYFDLKYYSKFLMKNSAGTWLQRTSSDDDLIVLDSDEINGYLYECMMECAQQIEGADSEFDIDYATKKLYGDKNSAIPAERVGFYQVYRAKYPTQAKKMVGSYYSPPRFGRNSGGPAGGRW